VADSNVGIGTDTPAANLHVVGHQYVNDPPTLANSFDHSDAPLTLTHGTPTSTTAFDDPKAVLHLTRDGTDGESYGSKASFKMSRYENSGTASRSRLDVTLTDGTYIESNVLSLRADGRVGIGTTTPGYTLDVRGTANVGALTATSISGPLSGNATTAAALETARNINGVSFDGTGNITITANTPNTLTRGSYLTGSDFDGSAATTWAVDATTTNTASKIVARDSNGDIFGSYVNISHVTGTRSTDTIFYSSTDDYIRKTNATGMRASLNVPTRTGGDASGTWGISITGNAASATNVRVDRDDTGDTSMYLTMVNNNTAENSKRLYMDTNLVYDNTNNELKLNSLQITDYIYHSGDTDTYFGFDGDDHFRIVEGGGTRLQVDSNGYIGIGTTSPSSILTTHGGNLHDGNGAFTSKVCATLYVGRGGGSGASTLDQGTGGILEFRHASDHRYITIESVSEASYSQDIGLLFKTTDTDDGPQERMRIDAHGNVGIGTTSPGYKLDVSGTARFTGTVTAPTFSGNATSATTATNQSGGSVSATTGNFSGDLTVTGKIYNYNYTEVDINVPATVSGTWTTSTTSNWGDPKFNNTYDRYRYNDAPGYVEYTIPTGMKSAYLSQLTWGSGGYVDIHGVQADGGLVFLRRINTRQAVENSNEGNPDQHDGSTVTFAGSGLEHFTKIRLTNKSGRFHLSGLAFTPNENEGTEGVGMVHSAQISDLGSGIPTPTGTGASGSWGISITGNAATATKLATARAINGVNFDGSAAITVNGTNYNVNNSWLREQGDNAHFRQYGNTRQMAFRTDGTTEYASGVGGYPFVWMYGGDEASNRRMLLNSSGQLWCSNYGWLHDKFVSRNSATAQTFTDNNSNASFTGHTIDFNGSGTQVNTANRTHRAFLIDYDTSVSGGTATSGQRNYHYAMNSDMRHGGTGNQYVFYNQYLYTRSDHTSGTCSNMKGVDNIVVSSGTGLNTTIWGINTYVLKDGGSTGATTTMYGIKSEVEVDAGTVTNAYAYHAHIDRDAGTLTNGYLYYGSYAGTVGTKWGLYLTGETKNYFSGNVGIGTTSPGYKLDVNGTLHAGNSYFDNVYIGGSTSRGLRSVSGNYGTVQTTGGGAGNWEGYSIEGRYVFMSADNNSCGIYNDLDNEWMVYCYRNSYTRLYYNGAQKLETTNTGVSIVGDIYASGNITAYSDIRKKENLQIIETPIEKVKKINGYTYEMDERRYTGLVAQEVLEVLPEAVVGDEENGYGLAYGNMAGLFVEAMKDMNSKLDDALARLSALENTLS